MGVRATLSRLLTLIAVVAAISILIGAVLGQPVLLSYVETESMQPTLAPGDGFVAVPAQIAGPIEEGDIVTFRAEAIHGGGLTTHRIVAETERGYITKGDANPFTDQSGTEPPVKDAQVIAVALQIGGDTVVIPHLGTAVTGTRAALGTVQRRLATVLGMRSLLGVQGLAYLFFAATVLVYAIDVLRERGETGRRPNQTADDRADLWLILGAFATVLVVAATASMVVPAGTQQYGIVSAEFDSPGARVIPMGTSEATTYVVANGGFVPVVVYLEPASESIDVRPREVFVGGNDHTNATVTLTAPPDTGYYRRFLVEHRYLALLPAPVIRALYQFHPLTPIVAIDAVLWLSFYLFGAAMLHIGRVPGRRRALSLRGRFFSAFRKLY